MPILILEDNPRDAELIIEALRKAGFEFDAKHATTKEEFLAALRNHAPELILADYALCDFNGFSALAAAQEQCPEVPFIFVSGLLGDERVLSALHHGATDCVSKDRLDLLGPIAHHALREKEEVRKRKQAEHARQETSELYRTLAEQSADAIVILDPATTRPVEFNTAAHRQLGYSREEFAQLRLADIDAIKTPEEIQAIIAGMLHDGRRKFETQHRTRDGQIRDVEVTAQVVELSGRYVYHCIWRDITERKRVEERLHLLSQAMEVSANATVVTDRDGVITWANPAFAGLTGYPLAEALGQKISFLKSGAQDQAFYQRLWETVLGGRVWFSEIINKRKDGSLY
ncbi:MAG: PAS domain S-box protein, partial [Verrucomicrobiota bacterium]